MAGILTNTKNNILRNKWLSLATVLVASIVFLTASFFIIVSLIAQRAVQVSETKAQLQIYFQVDTPEGEVLKVKEDLEKLPSAENVTYISQEEALQLYLDYYSDDPELIESVSADWLPPSLEVRATSIEELETITLAVRAEQEVNPNIEEVVYHEDVVNQLKSLSKGINVGAIGIIFIFSVITISLVFITIAFNINAHKREIEIMHLVGSSDSYIKVPFILEGVVYTSVGALVAAVLLLIPWYILMNYNVDSNVQFILSEITHELKLNSAREMSIGFLLIFILIHLLVGAMIGLVSSWFAVMKNLNLKEK